MIRVLAITLALGTIASGSGAEPQAVEPIADAAVDSLIAEALRASPLLQAGTARIAAARAGAPAAGALPDPMVGFSLRGEDYPGAGIGTDPMAMAAVEFSQVVPWPGKRSRREDAAVAGIEVALSDLEVARRRTAAELRTRCADLSALAGSAAALRESIALVDLLIPQVAALYETGQAEQEDLLRLRIERARQQTRLEQVEAERTGVSAGINAVLDRDPRLPVPPANLAVAQPDSGQAAPAAFAEVQAEAARAEVARRIAAAAEREGAPDLVLGAEYGWRDTIGPMITARVGLALPLWRGRKQDATAREARSLAAVADAERRMALAAAGAEIVALQARLAAATQSASRLSGEILPQAALAVDAEQTSYATGRGGIEPLVNALQLLAESRADLARSEADVYSAWATLRALAGMDPACAQRKE